MKREKFLFAYMGPFKIMQFSHLVLPSSNKKELAAFLENILEYEEMPHLEEAQKLGTSVFSCQEHNLPPLSLRDIKEGESGGAVMLSFKLESFQDLLNIAKRAHFYLFRRGINLDGIEESVEKLLQKESNRIFFQIRDLDFRCWEFFCCSED